MYVVISKRSRVRVPDEAVSPMGPVLGRTDRQGAQGETQHHVDGAQHTGLLYPVTTPRVMTGGGPGPVRNRTLI
jgi:hypothetical protein